VDKPERLLEVATELNARPCMTLAEITQAEAIQCLLSDPSPSLRRLPGFPNRLRGQRQGRPTDVWPRLRGDDTRCLRRTFRALV